MKNLLVPFVLFVSGCASLAIPPVPTLQLRTLRISTKVPGFEYQYEVCVKEGLFGNCRQKEMRIEYYDLTVPEVRDKLINMGFVAKVREKVLP